MDSVEWLGLGSNCAFAKSHILKRFCGALLFTSSTCQKSDDFTVWECAIRKSQPADFLRFFQPGYFLSDLEGRSCNRKLNPLLLCSGAFLVIV